MLLWGWVATAAFAQSPLHFTALTPEQGLSQASALSVTQDRDGFIWIGTQNGLNRWDGYRVTVFRPDPDDPHSIIDSYVPLVAAHPDGSIWTSTSRSVFSRYDPATGRFHHYPIKPDSLADGSIHKLAITPGGDVFALINERLFHLDGDTIRPYPRLPDDPGREWYFPTLAGDRKGQIWLSSRQDAIYRLDPVGGITGAFSLPPLGNRPPPRFNQSGESPDGTIWFQAHHEVLCRLDPASGQVRYIIPAHAADPPFPGGVPIVPHRDHRLCNWMTATVDGQKGIFCYNPVRDVCQHHPPGERPGMLTDITLYRPFQDRSGLVWLGGMTGGARRVRVEPPLFSVWRHDPDRPGTLSGDQIKSIYRDRHRTLWVGTRQNGMNVRRGGEEAFSVISTDTITPGRLSGRHFKAIAEDRDGRLWIGGWQDDTGLFRYERETDRFIAYRHDPDDPHSPPVDEVRSLLRDSRGRLWVGMSGGLCRYRSESDDFRRFPHDPADAATLSDDDIMALCEDGDGAIWVGTWKGGINRIDPDDRITRFPHIPGDSTTLRSPQIYDIHLDRNNRLWIATSNGLHRYRRDGTFRAVSIGDGPAGMLVAGILEDDRGHLWLGTGDGLVRYDPDNGGRVMRAYTISDGLPAREFEQGAFFRDPGSGRFYMGTPGGLVVFHPDSIGGQATGPPTVLTEITVNGEPLATDTAATSLTHLALRHDQSFLSLEFAALDYTAPERNEYRYRIDGLHDGWIHSGTRRYVSFSNLAPGHYIFRVQGSNPGRIWGAERRLSITMAPPPWRTPWAYAGYLIALALAGWGLRWAWMHRRSLLSLRARRISHFRLLEEVGSGGMGVVYRALDRRTREIVAVKLLHQQLLEDLENRRRLISEGHLLATFNHPHIVRVHEVGESEGHGYIAMEYLPGGDLKQYIREHHPLPEDRIRNLAVQVAGGLAYIHKRNIIHRDLKTGNIMLADDGSVRIMDFGLSRSPLVTTMTSLGTVIGTLGYVAPEQITNRGIDHRSDLFSLGVVLYELLTGEMPFAGENEIAIMHAIFNHEPPRPSERRPGLSPLWDDIVAGLLEKAVDSRIPAVEDVLARLAVMAGDRRAGEPVNR